ncbi:NUDIX domain-containing protein (plasmid) [Haladaptatus sp. SPP-AMP-3]|uniref:NUDIX domain-containing protein n=1 Tax=Haladaptatus sp. SPP-AMP-3 TaxID=3121295 RepID=UPI003C2E16CA
MSFEVNRAAVERRMNRLLDEYGDVPVEERTQETGIAKFEELVGYARDGYTGGAYAWVVRRPEDAAPLSDSMPDGAFDDCPRALMILNRGADSWGLPGGGREDGETSEEAAVREVEEETNVTCELADPFLLRRLTVVPENDDEKCLHLLLVFFDADYLDGDISIQSGELNGAAWFAEPPSRMLPANELRADDWF